MYDGWWRMMYEKLSHIMEISENNKNIADLANWAEPFWKRSVFALLKNKKKNFCRFCGKKKEKNQDARTEMLDFKCTM